MFRNVNLAAKGITDVNTLIFTAPTFAELLDNPEVLGLDQVRRHARYLWT